MNNTTDTASLSPSVGTAEWNIRHTFYVILFVLGFCGNSLVLIIVSRKKSQRTAHHIFIMNLAASDLCFVLLYFPIYFRRVFFPYEPTVAFCKIIWPVLSQVFFSSIFTVTSMAIMRCYSIVNPYKPQMTQKKALIWVLVIWLLSYLAVTPGVAYATSHRDLGACYTNWPSPNHGKAFFLFVFISQYVLPLLVTAGCYIWIGVDISKASLGGRNQVGRAGSQQVHFRLRRAENMRVIKSLAIIVLFFALLMLPKHMFQFCYYWGKTPGHAKICLVLHVVADICIILHACFDPFLYGTVLTGFRQDFKKHLKHIFCFWRSCLPSSRMAVNAQNEGSVADGSLASHTETFRLSSYTVDTSVGSIDTTKETNM